MIVRTLKLKPTKKQEAQLLDWLNILTGVYNWGLRKIECNAQNKIFFSKMSFQNLLAGHGKKIGIPSHIIQGILVQVHNAWTRCFKKIAKKPHLKGMRNKLNSIPFPDKFKAPVANKISILGLGKIRYHKQELPPADIKCGRIIKKSSGWYLCLWLDTNHTFPVKKTSNAIGIDPGFSTLLTLSDGTKIENPRELRKGAHGLAQAQKGKRKKLAARLQERQANRRKDRNHKISRWIIENYATIYYSDDNFKGMAAKFGKSVAEAGLKQLIDFITYKGSNCGRMVVPVSSFQTTMTCSSCGSLTGPTGLSGLAVRVWNCSACGAQHDRDINSAKQVLKLGLGTSLSTGIPRL
jgi:transposase